MKKLTNISVLLLASCMLVACGGGEESTSSGGSGGNVNQNVTVGFSRASVDTKEGNNGNTVVKITFQANTNVNNAVTIGYTTEDGTAKSGVDYVTSSGEVTITKGTRTADIVVNVIGNDTHQSGREFKVLLSTVSGSNMTLNKGTDTILVRITDDDPEPVVNFEEKMMTVHENIGTVDVSMVLDRASDKETKVNLNLSGLANRGVDYTVESTTVSFAPLETKQIIQAKILSDDLVEGTEDITISMGTVTGGKTGETNSMKLLITGDLRLPDTGYTGFYNNGQFDSSAPDSNHPYQDASYGLDTDVAHNGNGHAGFVFQKIDNSGNPLPAGSNSHTCVYDNHTGLTWEVKGGIETLPENEINDPTDKLNNTAKAAYANRNWFSKRNRYFWNNPDNTKNGGSVGGANGNEWDNFDGPHHISQNCAFISRNELNYVNVTQTGCASHKYVELMNKFARCGHKDWRMPTIQELSTLTRYESTMSYIDGEYFKDEGYPWGENMRYLSSTPAVGNGASVWCLNSDTKEVMLCNKQQYNYIRLVRGNAL